VAPDVCHIDEFGPLPVVRPTSVAELGDAVRRAAADGLAVYPTGGRTMLGQGLPPARQGVAIDVRGLAQVVDYPARDMTITVQAGIRVAWLQGLLATENQRLPIDVPLAGSATLGGALATNASGPRRLGFGTLRDYVIGISVVNDEGQETKAGGRVVKNVAGYDLCKLHVGALGTLGVITQVTLKLRPRPEAARLLVLNCLPRHVPALLEVVRQSRTRPVCVELLNHAAADGINLHQGVLPRSTPAGQWALAVGYEDNAPALRWQVEQLRRELPADLAKMLFEWEGPQAEAIWKALADFPLAPDAPLTFKANLRPGATADFFKLAAELPEELLLAAHASSGIVVGHAAGAPALERAREVVTTLQAAAVASGGNLVLLRCPPAWKKELPVWGAPRGDAALMRAVKEKFDPKGLFNPGRFLDGL
jgi:glycolate oxidase FAD binding subunit